MADFAEEEATGSNIEPHAEDFAAEVWQSAYTGPMVPMPWYPMASYWPSQAASSSRWQGPCQPCPSSFQGGGRGGNPVPPPQKQRFCATFPNVGRCRHGPACAFAHTREEVTAPLLSPEEENYTPAALTESFFTQRFKTLWCPIGAQHDWQACMYAHTYQDVRRPPDIGYGHQLCPYWNKKDVSLAYSQRCPLGPRCPYAHGAKEQLYHPQYFRTLVCRDLQRRRCPRGQLCAFFHRQADYRKSGADAVDYNIPLSKEALPGDWLTYFLSPPRFQEVAGEDGALMAEGLMPAPMEQYGGCGPASRKFIAEPSAVAGQEEEETTAEEELGEGVAEDSAEDSGEEHRQPVSEALEAWPVGTMKQGLMHDGYAAAAAAAEASYAAGDTSAAAAWVAATGADDWGAMPYYGYNGMYSGFPGCYMDQSGMYSAQAQQHQQQHGIWEPDLANHNMGSVPSGVGRQHAA